MATQFDPIAKDESLNTTEATPRNIADVLAEGLKGIEDALPPSYTEGDGIDLTNNAISVDTTFTEASTRTNIASGDSFSTILGKIKKFFTDLKAVAFSGAAADVTYGSGTVENALNNLNTAVELCECLVVSATSVNSLPVTINNANITSDMVVVNSVISSLSAQLSNWAWETANGSITLSGTIQGTTNITLYLMKSR